MNHRMVIVFCEAGGWVRIANESVLLSFTQTTCIALLIKYKGSTVSKEQIMDECWRKQGVEVTEASVRQLITQLRKIFSSIGGGDDVLQTVSRQGYRLKLGVIITVQEAEKLEFEQGSENGAINNVDDVNLNKKSKIATVLSTKKNKVQLNFIAILGLSMLTSVSVFYLNYYPEFQPVSYRQHSETKNNTIFIQDGFKTTDDAISKVKKFGLLHNSAEEKHHYIYINHTSNPRAISAFICSNAIEIKNSTCINFNYLKSIQP